jgi:hypothetical protein
MKLGRDGCLVALVRLPRVLMAKHVAVVGATGLPVQCMKAMQQELAMGHQFKHRCG